MRKPKMWEEKGDSNKKKLRENSSHRNLCTCHTYDIFRKYAQTFESIF